MQIGVIHLDTCEQSSRPCTETPEFPSWGYAGQWMPDQVNGESLSPLCLEQGLTPRGKAQRFDRGLRLRKKENEEAYEGRGRGWSLEGPAGP